jgi:hypothetical protein
MGCACNQNKRLQYEVVLDAGRGRVAFTNGSKPTAITASGRYKGSAVRIKSTGELIHHSETYEVTQTTSGPVLFASSDLEAAKANAATRETGYVRERETGEIIHTHPAVLGRVDAMQKKVVAASDSTTEAPE